MATETEIKFYTPDLEAVRDRLEAIGAKIQKTRLFEHNIRYDDIAGTFVKQDKVLRLRQDDRIRLTYKERSPEQQSAGTLTRLEIETEVSDVDAMHELLGKIGYSAYMAYQKYRTTYTLYGAEVVLDEMPYGNFIEIEGPPPAIEQIINELELTVLRRIYQSYADLFELVKHKLGLTFRDLTFENFADVSVPDEIFLNVGSHFNV